MTNIPRKSLAVINYWNKLYSPKHHCGLCGNCGIIDSRGVKTAAGYEVGDLFWCICPNGQALRKSNNNIQPTQKLLDHYRS